MTKQVGYAAYSVLWPGAVCGARCAPYFGGKTGIEDTGQVLAFDSTSLILDRNPHRVTRGKGLEQAEDIQAGDRQTGAPTDKHAGHLG